MRVIQIIILISLNLISNTILYNYLESPSSTQRIQLPITNQTTLPTSTTELIQEKPAKTDTKPKTKSPTKKYKLAWDLRTTKVPWYKQKYWLHYIKHSFPGYKQLKPDDDYCQKVKQYRDNNPIVFREDGLPSKQSRIVHTDYTHDKLTYTIIKKDGVLTKFQKEDDELKLHPGILLFWFIVDRHYQLRFERNFVCEGQIYNRIPGAEQITLKDTIINTINEYSGHYKDRPQCFNQWHFLPKTFVMNKKSQCLQAIDELALAKDQKKIKWILKKSRGAHQGKGVEVVTQDVAEKLLKDYQNGKECGTNSNKILIQSYIQDVLLLHGRKFDFRVFMLIAKTNPYLVLYNEGYLRLSVEQYDIEQTSKYGHLTNVSLASRYIKKAQEENQEYDVDMMKNQVWYFDQFEEYMISIGKAEPGWLDNYVRPQIKKSLLHIARSVYPKLMKHPRVFQLYGMDFLFDTDLNLWLLEVNSTPGISGGTDKKADLMTKLLQSIFDIEYALLYNVDLDRVLETTSFEFLIDGRKKAPERLHLSKIY